MSGRIDIANLAIALIFAAVLALLAAGSLLGPVVALRPLQEKRELAVRPEVGTVPVRQFPRAWEAWFNDHFGYRPLLVRADALLRLRLWRASRVGRVLPGRDGWLFYDGRTDRGGDPRANFQGRLPDDHERLFEGLQAQLEHTRDWLAARDVGYLLVVVPDKWSIYPQYLPGSVGPGAARTSSDRFLDHLREHSDLEVLDLKPALREAAAAGPVYHRQDLHWNDAGALAAARAIARRLVPDLPGLAVPDPAWFRAEERKRPDGDLVEMLGLDGWLSETETRLLPRDPGRVVLEDLPRAPEFPNPNRYPIAAHGDDPSRPRLLMLRDSFGDALIPFLAPAFSESRFLWTSNFSRRDLGPVLDELRPDVVVELRAEKLMLDPRRYYLAPGMRAIQVHPGKG